MKGKWTPGPWKAMHNGHYYDIVAAETPGGKTIVKHDPSIASVIANDNYTHTKGADTERANAHLIAAAPDLADALWRCIEHMEWSTPEGEKAFIKAKAAITKAIGGDK